MRHSELPWEEQLAKTPGKAPAKAKVAAKKAPRKAAPAKAGKGLADENASRKRPAVAKAPKRPAPAPRAKRPASDEQKGKAAGSALQGKPWLKSYPANVPAEIGPLAAASIGDLLVGACKQYAGRPAFTCMGKSISFGAWNRQSAAFGSWLQGRGLAKGARVAIMMPNVLQYPIAIMGSCAPATPL